MKNNSTSSSKILLAMSFLFFVGIAFSQNRTKPANPFKPIEDKGFGSLVNQNVVEQSQNYTVNWSAKPFDFKVFIENKGQFDAEINSTEKVFYWAKMGKTKICF